MATGWSQCGQCCMNPSRQCTLWCAKGYRHRGQHTCNRCQKPVENERIKCGQRCQNPNRNCTLRCSKGYRHKGHHFCERCIQQPREVIPQLLEAATKAAAKWVAEAYFDLAGAKLWAQIEEGDGAWLQLAKKELADAQRAQEALLQENK